MAGDEKPNTKKRNWDMPARVITSLAQRNLRIAVGARAEKWIPPGSPLRSATAERVFDVIKNEVEEWAASKGGAWKIIVEELLIDALDKGLAANVFGKGEQAEVRNPAPAEQILRNWWDEAVKAVIDADKAGEDPQAIAQAHIQRFETVKVAINLLETQRREADGPAAPITEPVDRGALWRTIDEKVEAVWQRIDGAVERAAAPVGRLAEWLESKT